MKQFLVNGFVHNLEYCIEMFTRFGIIRPEEASKYINERSWGLEDG